MLPHYREQHLRLRQMAGQIRANLQQMTGIKSAYPNWTRLSPKMLTCATRRPACANKSSSKHGAGCRGKTT
jgi:hypothetical protein